MATKTGDDYGTFLFRRGGKKFMAMAIADGKGWDHVSVSVGWGGNRNSQCPTWDVMCWVKHLFFEPEECVVQFHPRASDYVNYHHGCLHLWRFVGGSFPMPPIECV